MWKIPENIVEPQSPDNRSRFLPISCVLGSDAYHSVEHCWDVDVGTMDNRGWVWAEGAERGQANFTWSNCSLLHKDGIYRLISSVVQGTGQKVQVRDRPRRIRVVVDMDRGCVEFYEPPSTKYQYMDFITTLYDTQRTVKPTVSVPPVNY